MNCKYCRANCTGAKHDREIALCLGYDPPKTNGDNFRAMTDEELAQYICKTQYRDGDFCPPTHNCELDKSCEKCWLDWLRQECE